jgi:hypothetical protein
MQVLADVDAKDLLAAACVQPCWVVLNDERTLQCYENVKLRLGCPRTQAPVLQKSNSDH